MCHLQWHTITILLYLSFLLFFAIFASKCLTKFSCESFFLFAKIAKKNGYQIFTTEFNPGGTLTLGKLLYQQNQDATYINKLTTNSFKQVRRIKMTTQLCVYVDSIHYSSSNNNGANIFWGSCSLETSNQKFFPSYIGSVFWGVKCGTQQFYGIFKKTAPLYQMAIIVCSYSYWTNKSEL